MSRSFNPRWLVGKTIASVDLRTFCAEEMGRGKAHDPVITFTDGSSITFTTQETETGEYGTGISYHRARKP